MKRAALAWLLLLALAGAAHAFGLGLGNRFGKLGVSSGAGTISPPPTCSPGAPTGQMDFSVCSNVGITAATW